MNILIAGLLACGCVSLIDAPLWPSASDYINVALNCSQSSNAASCEKTRKSWTSDFDDAIAGKNQAQRILAHCLSTGCDGAVKTDPILGCAWDKVANSSTDGDTAGVTPFCGLSHLNKAGKRAAEAEAKTLRQMLNFK